MAPVAQTSTFPINVALPRMPPSPTAGTGTPPLSWATGFPLRPCSVALLWHGTHTKADRFPWHDKGAVRTPRCPLGKSQLSLSLVSQGVRACVRTCMREPLPHSIEERLLHTIKPAQLYFFPPCTMSPKPKGLFSSLTCGIQLPTLNWDNQPCKPTVGPKLSVVLFSFLQHFLPVRQPPENWSGIIDFVK